MKEVLSEFWEVLVPVADNDGADFEVAHHQQWDEKVRAVTGGLTIMRTVKGQWEDSNGDLFAEHVIPVRVMCDETRVRTIMDLTMNHYGQLAVMAYRISDHALVLEAK